MSMMTARERAARERARTPHDKSLVGLLGPFVLGLLLAGLVLVGAVSLLHEVFAPIAEAFQQAEGAR